MAEVTPDRKTLARLATQETRLMQIEERLAALEAAREPESAWVADVSQGAQREMTVARQYTALLSAVTRLFEVHPDFNHFRGIRYADAIRLVVAQLEDE